MTAVMRLDWRGAVVASEVDAAASAALRETAAACVMLAQVYAPRDTGFMANTVTVDWQVRRRGRSTLSILWGNWTADYTLWVEIGARGREGRYFLRRAADAEYPKLARRIKARL